MSFICKCCCGAPGGQAAARAPAPSSPVRCALLATRRCASLWAPVAERRTPRAAAGARPSSGSSRACGSTLSLRELAGAAAGSALTTALALRAPSSILTVTAQDMQAPVSTARHRVTPASVLAASLAALRPIMQRANAPPVRPFAALAAAAAVGVAASVAPAAASVNPSVAVAAQTHLRCSVRKLLTRSRARWRSHR